MPGNSLYFSVFLQQQDESFSDFICFPLITENKVQSQESNTMGP
jgi:hypothetical protein